MIYPKHTRVMWVLAILTEFMQYVEHPHHEEDLKKLENFVIDLKNSHADCVHSNDCWEYYCGTGKKVYPDDV